MGTSGSIPCSAAQPGNQSNVWSYMYMQFVEHLLGAAMSTETSSERPAA